MANALPLSARVRPGSAPPAFQVRLEERLGGRPQYERFSSQLLDGSDAVMSRAYALRRLAQEFPPDVERQLSAEGRRELRDLGREHVAALARQSGEMDAALGRVLAGLGGTAAPARPARGSLRLGSAGTAGQVDETGRRWTWTARLGAQ